MIIALQAESSSVSLVPQRPFWQTAVPELPWQVEGSSQAGAFPYLEGSQSASNMQQLALSQQEPLMQRPVWHSLSEVHRMPEAALGTHSPPSQCAPRSQASSVAQVNGHSGSLCLALPVQNADLYKSQSDASTVSSQAVSSSPILSLHWL
jgi:hypothetical protein